MHFSIKCKYLPTLALSGLTSKVLPLKTTKRLDGMFSPVINRALLTAICNVKQWNEASLVKTMISFDIANLIIDAILPERDLMFSAYGQMVKTTWSFEKFSYVRTAILNTLSNNEQLYFLQI